MAGKSRNMSNLEISPQGSDRAKSKNEPVISDQVSTGERGRETLKL